MSLSIRLELPPGTRAGALLHALGLQEDGADPPPDANTVVELGRAATGATGVLVRADPPEPDHVWVLALPLIRAPWSADDVIPSVVAAVRALGGTIAPADPVDAWHRAHMHACRELAALCDNQGTAPPPFLPRADLDALHAWLLSLDALHIASPPHAPALSPTVFCLDPHDGAPTRLAVRMPRTLEAARARLAPLGFILCDLDEERVPEAPALFPITALDAKPDEHGLLVVDTALARARLRAAEGEALSRFRLVSPVEIVDLESLSS